MARKAQRIAQSTEEHLSGKVRIGEVERPLTRREAEAVAQCWSIRRQIAEAERALAEAEAPLWRMFGAGASVLLEGVCRLSLSERQTVTIADAAALRELLGARFPDLVREEVVWKPEPRLIALAADADAPEAPALRRALVVRTTPVTTWRAEP